MQSQARSSSAQQLVIGAFLFISAFLRVSTGQNPSTYFTSPTVSAGQNIGSFSALQPDGRILVNNGNIRLNVDGSVDSTYSLSTQVASGAQIAVSPSGMIIVGNQGALTECNSDGSVAAVLLSASQGLGNVSFVVQPDGKVIVWADGSITFGAVKRPYIARINVDGSLDTSFDPGYGPNSSIACVALQSDGKIIVGGFFKTFDQLPAPNLVRLNANGTVDTSFAVAGFPSGDVPVAVIEMSTGKILACAGIYRGLWLLNSDGSSGTQLGAISGGGEDFNSIVLQPDGKVLIGGAFTSYGSNAVSGLIRLNSDGSFDSAFSAAATLANLGVGNISTVAVNAAGYIYFGDPSADSYFPGAPTGFVRLQANGAPDLTFTPGNPVPGQVIASARSSNGRVFIAGTFVSVNGSPRLGIASLNQNGTIDTTFAPTIGIPWAPLPSSNLAQPSAQLVVLPDGSVLLSGTFSSLGTLAGGGIAHFLPNGSLDTSFNPTFNSGGYVNTVAVLPSGEWVIGGNFTAVDGTARANLAGFTSNGVLDPAFAASSGTNGPITLMVARPSGGVYVAGAFSEVGTNRNDSLAALNADGSVDTTFSASSIAAGTLIQALAPMSDGRLMVAFTSNSTSNLARLLTTGAVDLNFVLPSLGVHNFLEANVTALTVDSTGRAIVGFTEVSQVPSNTNGRYFPNPPSYGYYVARFDLSGNLDMEFVANGQQSNAAITSLDMGSDGFLVIGGSFAGFAQGPTGLSEPDAPLTLFDGTNVSGLILIPNASESITVAPALSSQPLAAAVSSGSSATFSITASGVGLSYQWSLNGSPIPFATAPTLSLMDVGVSNVGAYTVTVTNSAGSVTSTPVALSLTGPPLILSQPSSVSVNVGGTAALSVTATGSAPLSYQWNLNGPAIPGATLATLRLTNLSATQGGSFTVTVSNSQGSVTSSVASVTVMANTASARLADLSARAYVAPSQGAGDILIAGFVTSGSSSKQVLIRGVGPALSSFGVTGFLTNPQLTVFSGQTSLATTTSWSASLSPLFTGLGAFALPSGSNDTALLESLSPGAYTAQVTSTNVQNGVALAEVYDADYSIPADGNSSLRLINLSARAYVGTGANILIGGFVVSGSSSETVLIRAVGPTLNSLGVTGSLSSPVLTVYDSASPANVIASNSGWQNAPVPGNSPVLASVQLATSAVMSSVGAFSLVAGSADSAMVLTLPAGAYTAQVSGVNNSTGIALVEIYEIP